MVPFSKYELQLTVNGDTGLETPVNADVVTPPTVVGVAVELVGPIGGSIDAIVMPPPTDIPGPNIIGMCYFTIVLWECPAPDNTQMMRSSWSMT